MCLPNRRKNQSADRVSYYVFNNFAMQFLKFCIFFSVLDELHMDSIQGDAAEKG